MIKIYDRKEKKYYYEKQYGEEKLNFLYNNLIGRVLLKTIFANRFYSKINAIYNNSKISKKKIRQFVRTYNMTVDENEFSSFNDFFKRKKNIKIDSKNENIISPADAKLLVYNIDKNSKMKIKNSYYDVYELLQNQEYADYFENGIALVYRLSVDDYHRYCYVENGNIDLKKRIKGKLHTVSSISNRYKIFKENQREYEVINNGNHKIIQMEVGAMQIGKIVNNSGNIAAKGDEKGYFEYGGSTIIVLYPNKTIQIDQEILAKSDERIETKVRYGEKIGEKVKE